MSGEPEDRAVLMGMRVRVRREAKGMSQEKLAEAVGRTRPVITNIENGKRYPGMEQLFDIAEALDCSVCDLLP